MAVKREYIKFKNGDCKMCGSGCGVMFDNARTTAKNASGQEFTIYYKNKYTYPNYRGDDIRQFIKTNDVKAGDIIYTLKNGAYCKVETIEKTESRSYSYYRTVHSSLTKDGLVNKLKSLYNTDAYNYVVDYYSATLQLIDQYGNDVTSKIHISSTEKLAVLRNNLPMKIYIYPNLSTPDVPATGVNSFLSNVVDPDHLTTEYISQTDDRKLFIFTPDARQTAFGWINGAFAYEFAKYTENLQEKNEGEDTGGESTPGGQNGNFDDTSDNIDNPTLPVTNASSCGMVKMYELDLGQTKALASYLWSGAKEFYENLTKMFNDPMDSIISLSLAPIQPSVGSSTIIEICKYAINNVTGSPLTSQYASLNCGTVKISPYWGNALDYSPYTKASIYLPFIGTQELNIDDVMNRTVGVIYNIDLLSGACACLITCDGSVMYNFSGNVISQIPVSGKNALEMYKSVISAVTNTALAIGTGAGGVALAGDAVSNGLSVMGSKMTVQRGGTISATNGVLGVKFPYITILRANQSLPADFHCFKGYPSNITGKVSSFSGYTEVEYVHVTGINATRNELEMIENILKEGFII